MDKRRLDRGDWSGCRISESESNLSQCSSKTRTDHLIISQHLLHEFGNPVHVQHEGAQRLLPL